MKSEAELQHFFLSKLQLLLQPLEQYRIEKVQKMKKYMYAAIFSSLLIVLGIVSKQPILILFFCLPPAIFLGFSIQTFLEMARFLTKHFKNQILSELLSFLFEEYEYIANQRIAKSVLEKSMLFPKYIAIAKGEDLMCFKLGNTLIMFCETTALSNGEKEIFKGIFISASFNKNFKSKTFVLSANLSSLYNRLNKQLIHNFKRIKLEDIEFSKEFLVLSSDQVEARYILTPSLMKRLLDYKRKTRKKLSFSFVDNRLYCAIPNFTNLFEPALFEPFDLDFIKKNYNPIMLYTGLVEDLNLNLRIWSKQ
ncbi:MAG: DUF3137 domain-containing protein [Bacteroidota bacterium]|nr:MAG: DUF3137 domain-containing protein [Bacteroidota bacterium]